MADPSRGPGHGHQPNGAVEVRDGDLDQGLAPVVEPHHPGEEGHQLLRRGRGQQLGEAAVAAGAHHAGGALHPVDQLAVEVANLQAQAALAEIPLIRFRGLIGGDVQDTLVHRGQGDEGLGPGLQVGDGHLDRHGPAGTDAGLDRQVHRQAPVLRVHPGPGEADGAPRHPAGREVHGPVEDRAHIGTGPPVGGDRQVQGGAAGRNSHGLHGDQPIVDHHHQGQPRLGRLVARTLTGFDMDPRPLTDPVGRLVERQLELVRGVRCLGGHVPAGLEAQAGGQQAIGGEAQPVGTPLDRGLDPPGGRGIQVEGAARHPLGPLDRLVVVAAAVLAVPLETGLDPLQGPGDPLCRAPRAVLAQSDDREAGAPALRGLALEKGADAQARLPVQDRQGEITLDRATTRIQDPDRQFCHQGPTGRGQLGQQDRHLDLARRVGRERVQWPLGGLRCVVAQPEAVAGPGGEPVGDLDQGLALDRQPGRGGAIEEARVDRQHGRGLGIEPLGGRREAEVQPLGQEVLHQEAGLAQRFALGVRVGQDAPGPAHGGPGQGDIRLVTAESLVLDQQALALHPIRAAHDQGQGHAGDGPGLGVAHQGREVDGLAGAVDTPLGDQEEVQRLGCRPALDTPVGQVEGGAAEVEETVVTVARLRRDHQRGIAPGATQEAGLEAGIAGGIGGRGPEHVVVTGDELELGLGHRRGGGE